MADRETRAKLARAAARLNARGPAAGLLPPLVLMTDDERLCDPVGAARALPRGSLVILRAREDGRRAALGEALADVARQRDLVLLVAGDAVLAARVAADGIHLPQARAHEAVHWHTRFPRWLITCAAHDGRAIARAARFGAAAVLLSSVFPTLSHAGAPALGPMRLRLLAQKARIPVYALGGVDAETARRLDGAALAGIAAIGALSA